MKVKLTQNDERWARELANTIGVKILSINLSDGQIIATGDPAKVEEFQKLWPGLYKMGLQGMGGM